VKLLLYVIAALICSALLAPGVIQAATASANFTVTIGPAPPQTIASITPTSVTVNVTGTTCADGMLVTGLTANMSPSAPPFSGSCRKAAMCTFAPAAPT
jgi:hypothetical protein